jgi:uncharacterized protein
LLLTTELVDARFNNGRTALMKAAGEGQEAVVRLLLENGADPNVRLTSGWTAMIEAAHHG